MNHNGTEIYYDTLSEKYDELTAPAGAWNAPPQMASAIAQFDPGKSSLIVGVGTGLDVDPLLLSGATHIEGVDLSDAMLSRCRIKYPSLVLHHSDFLGQFRPEMASFDSIVCSGTLEFISNINGFFEKCVSFMNPGAHLFFTFEPIIACHDIQKHPLSTPSLNATGKPAPAGFTTYRRTLFDVLGLCAENHLKPIFHSEYVAQKKGATNVIYHLLVVKI